MANKDVNDKGMASENNEGHVDALELPEKLGVGEGFVHDIQEVEAAERDVEREVEEDDYQAGVEEDDSSEVEELIFVDGDGGVFRMTVTKKSKTKTKEWETARFKPPHGEMPYIHALCGRTFAYVSDVRRHHPDCAISKGRLADTKWDDDPSCKLPWKYPEFERLYPDGRREPMQPNNRTIAQSNNKASRDVQRLRIEQAALQDHLDNGTVVTVTFPNGKVIRTGFANVYVRGAKKDDDFYLKLLALDGHYTRDTISQGLGLGSGSVGNHLSAAYKHYAAKYGGTKVQIKADLKHKREVWLDTQIQASKSHVNSQSGTQAPSELTPDDGLSAWTEAPQANGEGSEMLAFDEDMDVTEPAQASPTPHAKNSKLMRASSAKAPAPVAAPDDAAALSTFRKRKRDTTTAPISNEHSTSSPAVSSESPFPRIDKDGLRGEVLVRLARDYTDDEIFNGFTTQHNGALQSAEEVSRRLKQVFKARFDMGNKPNTFHQEWRKFEKVRAAQQAARTH